MEATDFDQIAKKHGILLILQFGSSVTGKVHARSDVDLLHDLQSRFPTQDSGGATGFAQSRRELGAHAARFFGLC